MKLEEMIQALNVIKSGGRGVVSMGLDDVRVILAGLIDIAKVNDDHRLEKLQHVQDILQSC